MLPSIFARPSIKPEVKANEQNSKPVERTSLVTSSQHEIVTVVYDKCIERSRNSKPLIVHTYLFSSVSVISQQTTETAIS